MSDRELTIAGGGLAGLSLAAGLARRGVRVTVLEAGRYPRHRVCGEFISGVPGAVFERLGIDDLFADALRHRSVRWCERGREFHRGELPEAALGISRHELDERLRRRVLECGGVVRAGERARPEAREGLVWAAGRRPKPGGGRWLGLKVHARLESVMEADLEMHAGRNGYTGLARVEEGWVNVCGLFRAGEKTGASGGDLLPALLAAGGNTALAEALRAAPLRAGSFTSVAGFEFGRQPPLPGLPVIGDAESMIPPFTGHGMAMAFISAECALEPLTEWARGSRDWADTTALLHRVLRRRFARRLACARFLHPFLLGPAGQSVLFSLGTLRLLPFRLLYALVR